MNINLRITFLLPAYTTNVRKSLLLLFNPFMIGSPSTIPNHGQITVHGVNCLKEKFEVQEILIYPTLYALDCNINDRLGKEAKMKL